LPTQMKPGLRVTMMSGVRLAQHQRAYRDELFTFLCQPEQEATNWRTVLLSASASSCAWSWAEIGLGRGARAIRADVRMAHVLAAGRSALDSLGHLLCGAPMALVLTR
jgi:hypothetical protein